MEFCGGCIIQYNEWFLYNAGRRDAKETFTNRQIVFPSANFIKTYFASYSNDPISTTNLNDVAPENDFVQAKEALDTEKYEEIIPACTKEIESEDSDAKYKIEAKLLRGTMYLLVGSLKEAVKDFDDIINEPEVSTAIKVNALIKRASLNVQSEQHQKGFEDFNAAEQMDSQNADVYHQRGQVYILLEKLDEALIDFQKAVELAPEMCSAHVQKCYSDYRHACMIQNQVQIYNGKFMQITSVS